MADNAAVASTAIDVATKGAYLINPGLGLGLDLLGLVGKGVLAYQSAEDDEREKKRQEALLERYIAEDRRRWELDRDMNMKKYALSLDEWKEMKRSTRIKNKQSVEQQNYDRSQSYSNRLLQLANSGNRLLQVYGGAK